MDEESVKRGLRELDQLSQAEYGAPLTDVAGDEDPQRVAIRIGRLVGVLLKQPFADPLVLPVPSRRTGAYRAWNLVGPESFSEPHRTGTWQYQVLESIRSDLSLEDSYWGSLPLYDLALQAHHEKGFFGFFVRTVRKYICGDKDVRKKVEHALAQARKGGAKLPASSPEAIVGAGGLALGVYLVQAVPILGIAGAPVVGAVVVILYTLGVDAFCTWSDGLRTEGEEGARQG